MLAGSGERENARRELPALWRRGPLRTESERGIANHLLRNVRSLLWYQMMLNEGWTVRHAAEVLREAGSTTGDVCSLTNRWARPPPGTPRPGSSPEEAPGDIIARCMGIRPSPSIRG